MDTRQAFDYSPDHVAFGVELNHDGSAFSVGTEDGFRLFDTGSGKLIYERGTFYPENPCKSLLIEKF
jgi:hypothetical protein